METVLIENKVINKVERKSLTWSLFVGILVEEYNDDFNRQLLKEKGFFNAYFINNPLQLGIEEEDSFTIVLLRNKYYEDYEPSDKFDHHLHFKYNPLIEGYTIKLTRFKSDIIKILLGKFSQVSKEFEEFSTKNVPKRIFKDGKLIETPNHYMFNPQFRHRVELANKLGVSIGSLPGGEVYSKPKVEHEILIYEEYKETKFDSLFRSEGNLFREGTNNSGQLSHSK